MLKLRFRDSEREPVWVVDKTFTIGSDDSNSLTLDNASVSPHHAQITVTPDGHLLNDLGSTNGTMVNDDNITQAIIACGDVIKFGDVVVAVVDPIDENSESPWLLIGCSGVHSGKEFPLFCEERTETIVGRGKRCDISFPGTHLSKAHARFEYSDRGLSVIDLDSTNGIFVNDQRVTIAALSPGDNVRLDILNFKVYGPGVEMPKSDAADANPPEPEGKTTFDIHDEPTIIEEKQWVTRPTSPGNRQEPAPPKSNTFLIIVFSLVMVAILLGLTGYLFLPSETAQ